jgi:nucleotide-binding universal stress UspA family protein
MIAFSRILFPADLSEQARQAAPFVAAMARRFSSELLVLHVFEPTVSYYPVPAAATPRAIGSERERRQEQQQKFESFLAAYFGDLSKKSRFDEGDPVECIVSCAREFRADLIMMPTHGCGRFRRLLLGSVTAKVLHDAECPVWTGVHTDQMWQAPTAGWHHFLCAVDEDVRDAPVLKWAAQFAREQRAELQVAHAVHAAAPIPAGEESGALGDFLLSTARERLKRVQAEAGTELEIQFAFGPVDQVVREAALEQHADLIVIGRGAIRKGFGRLRSSAYEVIREAPCPVISL